MTALFLVLALQNASSQVWTKIVFFNEIWGSYSLCVEGMLSVSGKKVLHMDRNKYYGGDSASMTPLEDLFTKFGMPAPDQAQYGRGR